MTILAYSLTRRTFVCNGGSPLTSFFSTIGLCSRTSTITKREPFRGDMKLYRLDAYAVQETKLKGAEDFKLPGVGTLRIFSQQEGVGGSRGVDIFIFQRLVPFLKVISRVNDRMRTRCLKSLRCNVHLFWCVHMVLHFHPANRTVSFESCSVTL